MRRFMPLVVMMLGVLIAGAYGARNGESMVQYRLAVWEAHQDLDSPLEHTAHSAIPMPSQRLQEWFLLAGLPFLLGVGLIFGGALWARREIALRESGAGSDEKGRLDFRRSVQFILTELSQIGGELASLPMEDDGPEIRKRIDDLAIDTIDLVVRRRGQLIARHGLVVFAGYFSPFSQGERYLARTWSALTDGHAEVARDALKDSTAAFENALAVWDQLEAGN